LGQLGLRLGELVGEPPQVGQLVGTGRPGPGRPLLLGAQGLGSFGQLAPPGVGGEQRVEIFCRAAAGQRGPVAVRLLAGSLEVDHPGRV
jgi:hypothetical protein